MRRDEAKQAVRLLKRRGFDLTRGFKSQVGYGVRPRCSNCQALVINGVACHETGCPNQRRKRS